MMFTEAVKTISSNYKGKYIIHNWQNNDSWGNGDEGGNEVSPNRSRQVIGIRKFFEEKLVCCIFSFSSFSLDHDKWHQTVRHLSMPRFHRGMYEKIQYVPESNRPIVSARYPRWSNQDIKSTTLPLKDSNFDWTTEDKRWLSQCE